MLITLHLLMDSSANVFAFVSRTIPGVDHLFKPPEECIRHTFIPAVTGHSLPGNIERDLLALPSCVGGMGIINPIKMCSFEFSASEKTFTISSVISDQCYFVAVFMMNNLQSSLKLGVQNFL